MSYTASYDPPRAPMEDTKWMPKALLRLFGTLVGLIAMCLFAAAVSHENASYQNVNGNGDWTDGFALAPIILSLLYNPVAFIMHLMFRKSRPIHPAIRMVLDLLVWILAAPAIILCVGSGLFWLWTPATVDSDGSIDCMNFANIWSQECSPEAYKIGRLQIAGVIFLIMLFITHLTLFIFACVDLRQRQLVKRSRMSEQFDMSRNKDPEQRSQAS